MSLVFITHASFTSDVDNGNNEKVVDHTSTRSAQVVIHIQHGIQKRHSDTLGLYSFELIAVLRPISWYDAQGFSMLFSHSIREWSHQTPPDRAAANSDKHSPEGDRPERAQQVECKVQLDPDFHSVGFGLG